MGYEKVKEDSHWCSGLCDSCCRVCVWRADLASCRKEDGYGRTGICLSGFRCKYRCCCDFRHAVFRRGRAAGDQGNQGGHQQDHFRGSGAGGDHVDAGAPLFTYDVESMQLELAQGNVEIERMQNEISSSQQQISSWRARRRTPAQTTSSPIPHRSSPSRRILPRRSMTSRPENRAGKASEYH